MIFVILNTADICKHPEIKSTRWLAAKCVETETRQEKNTNKHQVLHNKELTQTKTSLYDKSLNSKLQSKFSIWTSLKQSK